MKKLSLLLLAIMCYFTMPLAASADDLEAAVDSFMVELEKAMMPDNETLVKCLKKAKEDYKDALEECSGIPEQQACINIAKRNYDNERQRCITRELETSVAQTS